ncbi:MAG: C-GCAxxG-C-C family protein [Candidatus Altiarchaeota archaeon]
MDRVDRAVGVYEEGFCCSQAILSTFADELGLDRETALKISQSFGGGIANRGDICGAVSGAYMVIGLKYGRTKIEDSKSKEKTYRLVKEFNRRFTHKNGSLLCRDLLGCDISTNEGKRLIAEKNMTKNICPDLVRDAAEILEEIL